MKLFKRNKGVLVEEKKEVKALDKMTQIKAIKEHLENGKKITSKEAFEKYGVTRLSAIIHRLRKEYGMNILTIDKKVKDRFGTPTIVAEYTLKKGK